MGRSGPIFGRLLAWYLFFGAFFFPLMAAVGAPPPRYRDAGLSVEERVEDLLSRMTLAEKIGQMTQIDRSVASPEALIQFAIGSVLNGGGSAPSPAADATEWADMIDGFQRSALSTRLGIPILYGTDAVHGHNNVVGATIFPHNIGLGAARNEKLVERIGRATALEMRATGCPYTFAPCLAVCRDPRWGRCYESYSEDTEVVRSMAKIIAGLQGTPPPRDHARGYPYVHPWGRSVATCAKHFAGDGGTTGGVNENNTVADYPDLFHVHIRPYLDAVAMGVSSVMASYSSWNGVKMHANTYLLTRVLKQEIGFQGFVVSDWEGVDRIGPDYKNSVKLAINAGFISDLTDLVLSGQVTISRIEDAVRRILRVKLVIGLFERPMADRSLSGMLGHAAHRTLAREAVRRSLVLLKNGEGRGKELLPLSKTASKIVVAGIHADDIGLQCGGWTITWAGGPGNTTHGTTILEGIKASVSRRTEVVFSEEPDEHFVAANADAAYAVVVVGERPYAESQGDDPVLTLPREAVRTITTVCRRIRCLVVVISGRPIVLEPYVGAVDALVAAWLPGSEAGKGIADVIFGDYDFTGRLPRTWFRRVDQLPMNLGDAHYDPLFPFGFGLSMNIPPPDLSSS
ncbi:unnamed protein product [Spirodela intermedia]|uniref:Uncharacterized protein n=1 Tax=Spirodela intermedia TaxID=51605 RepID=A0A7I8KWI1_SPIIN|nr:unnamed protein product [Spirodela intermedia]